MMLIRILLQKKLLIIIILLIALIIPVLVFIVGLATTLLQQTVVQPADTGMTRLRIETETVEIGIIVEGTVEIVIVGKAMAVEIVLRLLVTVIITVASDQDVGEVIIMIAEVGIVVGIHPHRGVEIGIAMMIIGEMIAMAVEIGIEIIENEAQTMIGIIGITG